MPIARDDDHHDVPAEHDDSAGERTVVPLFPMVDRPSQRRPLRRRLREVFGDELRRERHEQGRTLADVADDAAVSLPYLSEVERGVKDPSSEVIGAIADALELPVPELLERVARELRVATQRDVRAQLLAA